MFIASWVSIPVHLEVGASKLHMIYIIGGNYCKFIIKVRSLKNENDTVFLAFSLPITYN